jgi:hypothetical protein
MTAIGKLPTPAAEEPVVAAAVSEPAAAAAAASDVPSTAAKATPPASAVESAKPNRKVGDVPTSNVLRSQVCTPVSDSRCLTFVL